MEEKTLKNKTLKAFIVSYTLNAVVGKDPQKNVAIIAYDKKEAGNLFIAWAKGKNIYEQISGVVCVRAKKTNRNKSMVTSTYYKRQCDYVESLRKADA